jgi:hypothetical protein
MVKRGMAMYLHGLLVRNGSKDVRELGKSCIFLVEMCYTCFKKKARKKHA